MELIHLETFFGSLFLDSLSDLAQVYNLILRRQIQTLASPLTIFVALNSLLNLFGSPYNIVHKGEQFLPCNIIVNIKGSSKFYPYSKAHVKSYTCYSSPQLPACSLNSINTLVWSRQLYNSWQCVLIILNLLLLCPQLDYK